MITELVEAYDRFRGESLPVGYKELRVNWIIDIAENGQANLMGPFQGRDVRRFPAPDRYRSSIPSPTNLKPYLLRDNGQYALGILEDEEAREKTALVHNGFVDLTRRARLATSDPAFDQIIRFLEQPIPEDIRNKVGIKDWVIFRVAGRLLTDDVVVQEFWADHLAEEYESGTVTTCGACGNRAKPVKTLPGAVTILGQNCQMSSFNTSFPATESFGRKQLLNAPICYRCASRSIQTLRHLTSSRRHQINLLPEVQQDRPLQKQLAIFWLKDPEEIVVEGIEIDIESLISSVISGDLSLDNDEVEPEPQLTQLRNLLRVPWKPTQSALTLDKNAFYLAVLSANKGRLVVREWIDVSLAELRAHLLKYLEALNIVDRTGQARPVSVRSILEALGTTNPQLVRGLLRTAYLGQSPPEVLLASAVQRFRVPRDRASPDRAHVLAATTKLVLTYGKGTAATMATLDARHNDSAYHCGRLLAALDEIQRRHALPSRLNSTVVDRYYGRASTAPASIFGLLVRKAESEHLPKIRREHRGHSALREVMESVMKEIDDNGGFPLTLTLPQQAQFALGFYSQRITLQPWTRTAPNNSEGN